MRALASSTEVKYPRSGASARRRTALGSRAEFRAKPVKNVKAGLYSP